MGITRRSFFHGVAAASLTAVIPTLLINNNVSIEQITGDLGDISDGSTMFQPPIHPNCRCTLLPLVRMPNIV